MFVYACRMRTVEPIFRLQQEFVTFSNSAIGDLSESIKHLEKARVDYRAALLWMKDVSQRLHDPDARGQLAKFREVSSIVLKVGLHFLFHFSPRLKLPSRNQKYILKR